MTCPSCAHPWTRVVDDRWRTCSRCDLCLPLDLATHDFVTDVAFRSGCLQFGDMSKSRRAVVCALAFEPTSELSTEQVRAQAHVGRTLATVRSMLNHLARDGIAQKRRVRGYGPGGFQARWRLHTRYRSFLTSAPSVGARGHAPSEGRGSKLGEGGSARP